MLKVHGANQNIYVGRCTWYSWLNAETNMFFFKFLKWMYIPTLEKTTTDHLAVVSLPSPSIGWPQQTMVPLPRRAAKAVAVPSTCWTSWSSDGSPQPPISWGTTRWKKSGEPFEVGSLSHCLQGFKNIPGGCLGFLPPTVWVALAHYECII